MGRLWSWTLVVLGAAAVVGCPLAGLWAGHLGRTLADVPIIVLYYVTGLVAFTRRPDHLAARRILAFGSTFAVGFAVGSFCSAVLVVEGRPPWAWLGAAVLDTLNWLVALAPLALCAVFPDGYYHRRYERRVVVAAAVTLPVLLVGHLLGSPRMSSGQYMWDEPMSGPNPLAVPGLEEVGRVAGTLLMAAPVVLLAAVVLLVLRYRRFTDHRRRQTAWPLLAFALTVVSFWVLGAFSHEIDTGPMWIGYLIYYVVLILVPVSLLIGMLRYQLLDVDLVIRKSVVYGVIWALIAVAYVAVAAGFGDLAGRTLPLGVAVLLTILATLAVSPARRWLERAADRLVFGRRPSGYELISDLGSTLEASPAPPDVALAVATSVRDGLGLRWVRVVSDGRPLAVAGEVDAVTDSLPVLVVPLADATGAIGSIECGPKTDGRLTDDEHRIVEALGRQAALAIRNAQLSKELSLRLEELEASRIRLVQAEDAARRRLERDIHDGVQQELVAVLTRLAMARNQIQRDTALADGTMREVQQDTQRALENLQELSRGIHPPLLSDRGLLEAVEERATRLPIAVTLHAHGLTRGTRLPADVETAAYFLVSESLTNVLKHAGPTTASVRLSRQDSELAVEVCDTGRGFVPGTTTQHGLLGLRDRIETLGGRLSVDAAPGAGCSVRAVLPIRETADA